MPDYVPFGIRDSMRAMQFVDGENLAIRYGAILGSAAPAEHVIYERDVLAWSSYCNMSPHVIDTVRRYYYTSVGQDEPKRQEIIQRLKKIGIESPKVFSKVKGKRSKRVDISLATEMITHAHRGNYDLAVLVAGDEDYVPLVEAVQAEGCRVVVWFFEEGLSDSLRLAADHFYNIGTILLQADTWRLDYLHQ